MVRVAADDDLLGDVLEHRGEPLGRRERGDHLGVAARGPVAEQGRPEVVDLEADDGGEAREDVAVGAVEARGGPGGEARERRLLGVRRLRAGVERRRSPPGRRCPSRSAPGRRGPAGARPSRPSSGRARRRRRRRSRRRRAGRPRRAPRRARGGCRGCRRAPRSACPGCCRTRAAVERRRRGASGVEKQRRAAGVGSGPRGTGSPPVRQPARWPADARRPPRRSAACPRERQRPAFQRASALHTHTRKGGRSWYRRGPGALERRAADLVHPSGLARSGVTARNVAQADARRARSRG